MSGISDKDLQAYQKGLKNGLTEDTMNKVFAKRGLSVSMIKDAIINNSSKTSKFDFAPDITAGVDMTQKSPTAAELEAYKNWKNGINDSMAGSMTGGLAPFLARATGMVAPDLRSPDEITDAEKQGNKIGGTVGNILTAGATMGASGLLGPTKALGSALSSNLPSTILRGAGIGYGVGALQTPETAQKTGKWEDFLDLKSRNATASWNAILGGATSGLVQVLGNVTTFMKNKEWAGGNLESAAAERAIIKNRANKVMTDEYKNYAGALDKIDELSKDLKNPPVVDSSVLFSDTQSQMNEQTTAFRNFLKNNKLIAGKGDAAVMDIGKSELDYRDARDLLTKLKKDPAVTAIYNKINKNGFGSLNNAQNEIYHFVEDFRKNLIKSASNASPQIKKIAQNMNKSYGMTREAYKTIYPLISSDPLHAVAGDRVLGTAANPSTLLQSSAKKIFTPQQLADMETYRQFIANGQNYTGKGDIKKSIYAIGASALPATIPTIEYLKTKFLGNSKSGGK